MSAWWWWNIMWGRVLSTLSKVPRSSTMPQEASFSQSCHVKPSVTFYKSWWDYSLCQPECLAWSYKFHRWSFYDFCCWTWLGSFSSITKVCSIGLVRHLTSFISCWTGFLRLGIPSLFSQGQICRTCRLRVVLPLNSTSSSITNLAVFYRNHCNFLSSSMSRSVNLLSKSFSVDTLF